MLLSGNGLLLRRKVSWRLGKKQPHSSSLATASATVARMEMTSRSWRESANDWQVHDFLYFHQTRHDEPGCFVELFIDYSVLVGSLLAARKIRGNNRSIVSVVVFLLWIDIHHMIRLFGVIWVQERLNLVNVNKTSSKLQ